MNLKKIIILPVGFVLVHVLYIGCCKCIEGDFFRQLSSVRALHTSRTNSTSIDTVLVTDTLFTNFQLNYNLVTRAQPNPFNQLVSSAYATSCHCAAYGDKGYKYPIDSIVIKSDRSFNGVAPGVNLVSFFKGMSMNCNSSTVAYLPYLPVPQLLDSSAVCKRYDELILICNTPPGTEKVHNFKYLLYNNGKSFEATVKGTVKWQ